MKDIFAVRYGNFALPGLCRVVFYGSAFEVALMQFLYYSYSEAVVDLDGISVEAVQEFSDLRDGYLCSVDSRSVLGASIFFKKYAGSQLLDGFQQFCGGNLAGTVDLDSEELAQLTKEYAPCVKAILVDTGEDVKRPSYCTVGKPLAFLFGTEQDCNGYSAEWPIDRVISDAVTLLSGNLYNSVSDFRMAVAGIAGAFGSDGVSLSAAIQALMVSELVSGSVQDVHRPIGHVLSELLESVSGRGLYAYAKGTSLQLL